VDIETASYLTHPIPAPIERVGLFVNPTDQQLTETLDHVNLSMIQLHGNETPKRVQEIKARFGLPIIKAFGISTAEDLDQTNTYTPYCDWLLLDARPENLPGGNGKSFDWNILKQYDRDMPYMLAGGLTIDNAHQAISIANPHALDLSSGVESAPGIKDPQKIKTFLNAVKQVTV